MGGVLAALVLTVFTFGPSVDGLICQNEDWPVAAATAGTLATAQPANPDAGHSDDSLDGCIHGHCHHGAAYVPVELPMAETPAMRPSRQSWARVQVATSDPQFDLMRPPRA
jgi:hypothetical protein